METDVKIVLRPKRMWKVKQNILTTTSVLYKLFMLIRYPLSTLLQIVHNNKAQTILKLDFDTK